MTKVIYFYGIDGCNRPCFNVSGENLFFGDTQNLFRITTTEEEILEHYQDKKKIDEYLCYFGQRFNCEPMDGTPEEIEISLKLLRREEAIALQKRNKEKRLDNFRGKFQKGFLD